jgi:hypothetical protein
MAEAIAMKEGMGLANSIGCNVVLAECSTPLFVTLFK